MSPYRILAKDRNNMYHVLVAQLKSDKSIYIYERVQKVAWFDKPLFASELAYKPISKGNSLVVGHYSVTKDADEIHYRIVHESYGQSSTIETQYRILSACLQGAMEHYCEVHNLEISSVL